MKVRDCVQIVMGGLGESMIYDLTLEEYDIVEKVVQHIKRDPLSAKRLFDFIDETVQDISEYSVYGRIMQTCEEIDYEIDDDIYILEASPENSRSFDIVQTAGENCHKCNIYLPEDEDAAWCKGTGITKQQRQFLYSLGIQYIKWCMPVNGSYLPIDVNYTKISGMVLAEDDCEQKREVAAALTTFAALTAIMIGSRT